MSQLVQSLYRFDYLLRIRTQNPKTQASSMDFLGTLLHCYLHFGSIEYVSFSVTLLLCVSVAVAVAVVVPVPVPVSLYTDTVDLRVALKFSSKYQRFSHAFADIYSSSSRAYSFRINFSISLLFFLLLLIFDMK